MLFVYFDDLLTSACFRTGKNKGANCARMEEVQGQVQRQCATYLHGNHAGAPLFSRDMILDAASLRISLIFILFISPVYDYY